MPKKAAEKEKSKKVYFVGERGEDFGPHYIFHTEPADIQLPCHNFRNYFIFKNMIKVFDSRAYVKLNVSIKYYSIVRNVHERLKSTIYQLWRSIIFRKTNSDQINILIITQQMNKLELTSPVP